MVTHRTGTHQLPPPAPGQPAPGERPERVVSGLVISAVILFLASTTLLAVVMALARRRRSANRTRGPDVVTVREAVPCHRHRPRADGPAPRRARGRHRYRRRRAWLAAVGQAPGRRRRRRRALFVFLPPAGSIDVLNYAIYGRIAGLGHNPYLMRPEQLQRSGDPVGLLAPANWRTLPTIYGPVATAVQWAAAKLGGASMARIVFWIRLGNGIAFVVTAVGLVRLAGRDRARQARACLLWAVNPLMLFWLVGSGHVDVLLALLAVAALLMIRSRRRSRLIAGAVTGLIVGAATAIKTPFALAAWAWPGPHANRRASSWQGLSAPPPCSYRAICFLAYWTRPSSAAG